MLHSVNRVRHGCICWNWAETWVFGAVTVLLTHLWVLFQKADTSKTASARPDVFSRVRQEQTSFPPPSLPEVSSVLKEEDSGPSLDRLRLSESTIVQITTPSVRIWHHRRFCCCCLFCFFCLPASKTVDVKTPSSQLSRRRKSKRWKQWLNTFLLSSVRPHLSPLLSLVLSWDFHIYISYLYIFTRYKTDP